MENDRKRLGFTGSQLRESLLRGSKKGVKSEQSYVLAHFFSVARIEANLTIDELSEKTGVKTDELIDFELRQLHKYEAVKVAEALKETLNIEDELYKKILLDNG